MSKESGGGCDGALMKKNGRMKPFWILVSNTKMIGAIDGNREKRKFYCELSARILNTQHKFVHLEKTRLRYHKRNDFFPPKKAILEQVFKIKNNNQRITKWC